jgi:DUF2993 family protein
VRGCLFVLIAAAVLVALLAWFASPLLASAAIGLALQNGGFTATTQTVTATSDPPPKLLLGRADRVEIRASGVAFRTFHAQSLDLVLTDVDVLNRTAATITGSVDAASVTTADGVPTQADLRIDGSATAAATEIVVSAATVDRVVRATFADEVGVAITRTELVAPDVLRIVTPAATLEGRLVIDPNGAVALSTRLGSSPILSLDRSFPLRLESVRVTDGDLVITGRLDATSLLGG